MSLNIPVSHTIFPKANKFTKL